MSNLMIISISFVVLVIFFFIFGVDKIIDAKKEVNKKLCDEKIRYAEKKAEIWLKTEIKLLEKKKDLGLPPGGGYQPK